MDISIVSLSDMPEMLPRMARWFHEKWGIPEQAYVESMTECLAGKDIVPRWYAAFDGNRIIAGMGVIENDFHNRKDLSPNVCAVFTEPEYRGKGVARKLLDFVCCDMSSRGVRTLYLVTDHVGFYEKCGWKYVADALSDGESEYSRVYCRTTE